MTPAGGPGRGRTAAVVPLTKHLLNPDQYEYDACDQTHRRCQSCGRSAGSLSPNRASAPGKEARESSILPAARNGGDEHEPDTQGQQNDRAHEPDFDGSRHDP